MFKFLCLHGAGTSAEILRMQTGENAPWYPSHPGSNGYAGAIQEALGQKAGISFHFLEGEFESQPGPGVEGYYDGPFYSLYDWSLESANNNSPSIDDAYSLIYETIEDEGPFDGILGFSQGSATAFGFLVHHAKHRPLQPAFRCAVFFNGLPPFKLDSSGNVVYDDLEGVSPLKIPSLHIIGRNDFVRPHSLALAKLLDPASSVILEHDKGHEIPHDRESNARICGMLDRLCQRAAW